MSQSAAIRGRVHVALSALLDLGRLLVHPQWTVGDGRGDGRGDGIRVGKVAAASTDPVTVFMVGIRINRWLAPWHWLPLLLALPPMVRELAAEPDSGLLGYRLLLGPGVRQAMLVQYWRDAQDLHTFARDPLSPHRAAQQRFWRHYAAGGAAVGVWHELLPASAPESLYGNMPPTGIGALRDVRPLAWTVSGPAAPSSPAAHTRTRAPQDTN
jgi:Domain of unknown function (DUF4188)